MIRIVRGSEPDALRAEREWRLARVLLEWHEGGRRPYATTWPEAMTSPERDRRSRKTLFREGYTETRPILWRAQHKKCAYCEIPISHAEDTEHFRPVNLYWWLTWSWDNHFIVCGTCSGAKGHDFPLRDPPADPRGPDLDPRWCPRPPHATERATWIDPAIEDPRAFMRYIQETRGDVTRWTITGVDADDRGQTTIGDFGLDHELRDEQLNEYLDDLEAEDDLIAVRKAAARGEIAEAAWAVFLRRTVSSHRAPWRALAHDYLTHVRAEIHRLHGVELPPLPDITDDRPAPAPVPLFAPDPHLDLLDPESALRVRLARAPRVSRPVRDRALGILFDHRNPWPFADLRAIFPTKAVSTLNTWIDDAPDLYRDADNIHRTR